MKRKAVPVILSLFVSMLLASFVEIANAAPADDQYTLGITLYGQKRWDLAIETFEAYLKKFPAHKNVPLAKLYLAQGYVNKQNYKQARTLLRDFLKNHPKSKNQSQAMYRVAECSYFLDDYASASKDFELFLKKFPGAPLSEWALPYLANSHLHQGNAKRAEEVFRQSLKKFPKGRFLEDSYFGLARSLEILNRDKEAIAEYQQLTKFPKGKRIAEAMFNLGMLYFQQKDFEKTAETFTKLAENYPQDQLVAQARLNAGYAYFSLKKWDLSEQNFEAATKSAKYRDTAQFWLAQTDKAQGNYEQAEKTLQILIRSKPGKTLRSRINYQLAECHLRLEKYDLALPEFLEYIKQSPEGESIGKSYVHAVELCLMKSRVGQGWQLTEQAKKAKLLQQQEREIDLLRSQLLGKTASEDTLPASWKKKAERFQQADLILSNLLKQTDKIDPDNLNQQIRYQAAKIKSERGDYAEAIKILNPLTTALPEKKSLLIPQAWLLLASCHYESKNYKMANDASQQLLQLVPEGEVARQGLIVQLNLRLEIGQLKKAQTVLDSLQKLKLPVDKLALLTHQLADAFYAEKNWTEAEKLYHQMLKSAPSDQWKIKAVSGIGWSQFEANQFEKSAETFRSLRTQFPKSTQVGADAGYMRGMAKLKGEQLEEAAKIFLETALEYRSKPEQKQGNETHLIAYRCARESARAYRRLNKMEESAKGYKIAYEELRKQPSPKNQDLDKLLDEWALLYYEAAQYENADRIFELLIKETPKSSRADDAMLSLAESRYIAGKIKQARTSLEELAMSKRADGYVKRRALYQLVMIASEQKDQPGVKKFAEAYLQFIDYQKANLAELGEVETQLIQNYLDAKNLKEARTRIDQLMKRAAAIKEQQPLSWLPRAYVLSAEILRREKKYDQARQLLAEAIKKFPETEEISQLEVIAGRTYIKEANFAEAVKMFKSVINRSKGKKTLAAAQSQFFIAEAALKQKQYPLAIKEYISVAILYPGFPDLQSAAMFQAGQCDEVLGNVDQAINSYQELISKYPDSEFIGKAKARLKALKPVKAGS